MGSKWRYTWRLFSVVLPQVHRELSFWQDRAAAIAHPVLRQQARHSLHYKRFHCEGGSVVACQFAQPDVELVRGVVALQTLSDYLDNLVDRWRPGDEETARRLHQAFQDALNPWSEPRCYFSPRGPHDGGYAHRLVKTVQRACLSRPNYKVVMPFVQRLAGLYSDLQVIKHGPPTTRKHKLQAWTRQIGGSRQPALHWWELAAATGSTLAIFNLMALAGREKVTPAQAEQLYEAYFPWICSLHILLDYWIDQEEDRLGGDFNFTACYPDGVQAFHRLRLLLAQALQKARQLPQSPFHTLLVQGLPGLYLADNKVAVQGLQGQAQQLLQAAGRPAQLVTFVSLWRRRWQKEGSLRQPPPE